MRGYRSGGFAYAIVTGDVAEGRVGEHVERLVGIRARVRVRFRGRVEVEMEVKVELEADVNAEVEVKVEAK